MTNPNRSGEMTLEELNAIEAKITLRELNGIGNRNPGLAVAVGMAMRFVALIPDGKQAPNSVKAGDDEVQLIWFTSNGRVIESTFFVDGGGKCDVWGNHDFKNPRLAEFLDVLDMPVGYEWIPDLMYQLPWRTDNDLAD